MKLLKTSSIVAASVFVGFLSALSFSQIEIKTIKFDDKVLTNQKEFLDDVIARVKKDYVEEKTDRQLAEAAAAGILSSRRLNLCEWSS